MSEAAPEALDTWAIVEAMGHRTAIGRITEATIAGKPLIKVDRLDGITQYYPPESLYCLTPVPENVARKAHDREALGNGLPRAITNGISYDGQKYTRGLPSGDPASPWRADPFGDEDRCCCPASATAHQHETDEDGVCRHCGCEHPPGDDIDEDDDRDDEGPF